MLLRKFLINYLTSRLVAALALLICLAAAQEAGAATFKVTTAADSSAVSLCRQKSRAAFSVECGTTDSKFSPVRVAGLAKVVAVAGGNIHRSALLNEEQAANDEK